MPIKTQLNEFNEISWRSTQETPCISSHCIIGITFLCKRATIPILNLWPSPQNGYWVSIPSSPLFLPGFIFSNSNLMEMRKQVPVPSTHQRLTSEKTQHFHWVMFYFWPTAMSYCPAAWFAWDHMWKNKHLSILGLLVQLFLQHRGFPLPRW